MEEVTGAGDHPLESYLNLRRQLIDGTADLDGSWVRLTTAMDRGVQALSQQVEDFGPARMAAVALGSYGRRQLCIHSDIDLMILVEEPVDTAPAVFRALWDAGLTVGHAVRTPAEAGTAAGERTDTLCSLLDARLVCGDAALFQNLQTEVDRTVRRSSLTVALASEEADRRAREPHHLQAIDLKNGRGGLRTIHRMRWCDRGSGALDADEERLLRARQALHRCAGREHDVMDFSLRRPAAAAVGLDAKEFLGQIYQSARTIDLAATDAFAELLSTAGNSPRSAGLLRLVRSRRGSSQPHATANPWSIAAEAASRGDSRQRLTEKERSVFQGAASDAWTEAGRSSFIAFISSGAPARLIMDDLAEVGFRQQVLPEWDHVVSQAQLDPFHLHPVDDHLLRTAANAAALADPSRNTDEPFALDVADELGGLDEVLLAALFHDIGKGTGRDHSFAGAEMFETFAKRAGFDQVTMETVALLIREHLLLPEIATRHDLDDPAVITNVADRIGEPDVLRMLYLLTIADATATGPDVWSNWRGSLVRTLYIRTMNAITSGATISTPVRTARIAEVAERWSGEFPAGRIQGHLKAMPEAYALRTPATEVRRHMTMLDPPPSTDEARIDVVDSTDWSDIALVAADRTGLLAIVSGVLALSNISIVEARLATRGDGVVVDRLQVVDSLKSGPIDGDRWPKVMANLRRALRGHLELDEQLASKHMHYRSRVDATFAPEIKIITGADHGTHRLELRGPDRVGLLHDVSRVLHDLDIDVHFAKIDTQGGRVVDTFHVHLPDTIDHSDLTARLLAAAAIPK
jgi:[protein-PII] uridylyltransferase